MTVRCVNRPNRSKPRRFAERDAAKIVCRVVRAGGSKARIDRLYLQVCAEPKSRPQKTAAEAALELAATELQSNNDELRDAYRLFQIVNGLISLLLQLIPFTRIANVFARVFASARRLPPSLLAAKMDTIQAQIARNDAAFNIVRQAAANEARFRIAAGE